MNTTLATMPISNRSAEAEGLKRFLTTQGGTVLVVGARSTNFPEAFRRHPRITIWDSTESHTNDTPPANTRVVICLRFIGHQLFGRLHKFVRQKQALLLPGLNNTGEIKAVLSMALDIEPDSEAQEIIAASRPQPEKVTEQFEQLFTEPASTAADEPTPTIEDGGTDAPPIETASTEESPDMANHAPKKRGWLTEFLLEHADLGAESPIDEARKMLALMRKKKLDSTEASIAQAIYSLRRKADKKNGILRHAPKPRPFANGGKRIVPSRSSNIAEALKMLDDLTAGLGLLREAIVKVQQDDEQTQTTIAGLQEFLGKLGTVNHA